MLWYAKAGDGLGGGKYMDKENDKQENFMDRQERAKKGGRK